MNVKTSSSVKILIIGGFGIFFFKVLFSGAFKVGRVFLFFPRWVFLPRGFGKESQGQGRPHAPTWVLGRLLARSALPHVLYLFLSKIGILRVEPAIEDSESNLCQKLKVKKRAKENL